MTMAEHGLHPPDWPFSHKAFLPVPAAFDHSSIRRGFQVYREVCASCHSLKRVPWRRLVGVSHTVDEVKAMAADVEYEDGPNDEGEMFQRPGKLADYLPSPYPNDEAARNGNAGALPPDLSLICLARHGGAVRLLSLLPEGLVLTLMHRTTSVSCLDAPRKDALYRPAPTDSLITGYVDPPAGVNVGQNLNYSVSPYSILLASLTSRTDPYFPGGAIAMARVLYDGLVEFDDGTPATTSQMAKDVCTFLDWAGSPDYEDRKLLGWQVSIATLLAMGGTIWLKRRIWTHVKVRLPLFLISLSQEF